MRAVLLGLVLLNALFWAWATWVDTPPVVPDTSGAPAELPTLRLLSELDRDSEEADAGAELNLNDVEPLIVVDTGTAAVINVDSTSQTAEAAPVTATDLLPNPNAEVSAEAATDNEPPDDSPLVASAPAPTADDASVGPVPGNEVLASTDPVANPARCESVGPFLSLRQASAAVALLDAEGVTTQQRVEEAEVWVGHWVHLPPYPTREAAVVVVERLRREGVKDIYIESAGVLKNSVSLGLFSDIEGAEIRAGKVRRLGVRPQIQDRRRDGLVYWVDSRLDAGDSITLGMFDVLPNQELRIESFDCSQRLATSE